MTPHKPSPAPEPAAIASIGETATCPLCTEPGGSLLWRDADCRVVLAEEPTYPGFCRVIWNSHAAEMTELEYDARCKLMDVVYAVESLLRRQMSPHKINLASLGNQVPHLHWHVIPRFRDDPHFPLPIWAAPAQRSPGARAAPPVALLRHELGVLLGPSLPYS